MMNPIATTTRLTLSEYSRLRYRIANGLDYEITPKAEREFEEAQRLGDTYPFREEEPKIRFDIDREKMMFVLIALADRIGVKGKGFNRNDYWQFKKDWMPGRILNCERYLLFRWYERVKKYKNQLKEIGIEYPFQVEVYRW